MVVPPYCTQETTGKTTDAYKSMKNSLITCVQFIRLTLHYLFKPVDSLYSYISRKTTIFLPRFTVPVYWAKLHRLDLLIIFSWVCVLKNIFYRIRFPLLWMWMSERRTQEEHKKVLPFRLVNIYRRDGPGFPHFPGCLVSNFQVSLPPMQHHEK